MFENETSKNIMTECLAAGPEGIDKRKDGIFYDAIASMAQKLAMFYADLRRVIDFVSLDTAPGEYLDQKGKDYRITRNPATPACYAYVWGGSAEPRTGERFFADSLYFALKKDASGVSYLEAETPGHAGNNISPGQSAVPVNNIGGLTLSKFGGLIEPGADTESDDAYRKRIQEKLGGPADNGNRQHYKSWCEAIAGVGRARIIPRFAGDNTVMAVLISPDGLPVAQTVVDEVQAYVDPMTQGLTVSYGGETVPVGDGLGDGAANIGAHFAAASAAPVTIAVSFTAEIADGASVAAISGGVAAAMTNYLRAQALDTPEGQNIIVRLSAVNSLIYDIPGIVDYTELELNGASANIELTLRQIAVAGEVTVNAAI